MTTAQATLGKNTILRAISNKKEDEAEEPDNTKTHRSVGVDPDFYDMVDDNILSVLLDACKPLFDLVTSSSSPESKPNTMKRADIVMATAELIIAAGYKMKEQARQEMAEEDLGGGMFDQDVKDMRKAAGKCNEPQIYDAEEQQMLDAQLVVHGTAAKSLRKHKTGTELYSYDVADTGSGMDVRVLAEVRAPAEQVLAYLMGHNPQFDMSSDKNNATEIGERSSDHSVVSRTDVPMPNPFNDREIIVRSMWKKLDENTYFYSQLTCKHDEFQERPGIVSVDFNRSVKLTKINAKLTRVEGRGSFNLGGSIPRRINDTVTMPFSAASAAGMIRYFACVRPADSFDEGDGTMLGRLMFLLLYPHRQHKDLLTEKILEMIHSTNVLRSAQAKYRFMDEFIYHIMRNKMKLGASQTSFVVKTHLVALTANEAGRIARSFPMMMMANISAEAAVDELFLTFPALGELDSEYAWFRPMLNAIAKELMRAVAWGVKARAYLGAGVSAADALSDAFMIKTFFDMGDTGNAKGLLAMVGANLAWQAFIVHAQTNRLKKEKWRTALFELLAVVSFCKPGVDAHRVASGAEQLPGAALSPMVEMIVTKGGELFFEAIPGLVLQLVALLNAGHASNVAIGSILISTASTALAATTMFWDWDTDPASRKGSPDWAGLVPDVGRGSAFAALVLMSAFQVIAKAASVALLAVTNKSWLLGYVVADHTLHLFYKVARNDAVMYAPMPPAASYVTAPLIRVLIKTVSDFTGSPLLRLPFHLGGSYWLFNLAMSQVSVFVCVHLYIEHAVGSVGGKVAGGLLWAGAGGLAAGWLTTWIYFVFRKAVPKYRHTMWSGTTGRQCAQDYFIKGKDDEVKFTEIFSMNLLLWESDIGEEVKAWTAEGWERWKEEKPAWFKPEVVPDQFVPAVELEQLGHNRARRGSAAGSVRESFREVSVREDA